MQALPLEGIRVVEMGSWVAAPAAARILRHLGASVVKVEPPGGDGLRGLANPARIAGINPVFDLTNHGKRSLVLDLRREADGEAFHRLLIASDVFITNVHMGSLAGLGLTYQDVRRLAPRLIYCHVAGYDVRGPAGDRPAFDGTAYWAASGLGSILSEGLSSPLVPRPAMGDHFAAMAATAGICAALLGRQTTGAGRLVTTSLEGVGTYSIGWDLSNQEWVGTMAHANDRSSATNPLNNAYRCRDGKWVVLVNLQSDRAWPLVCDALGDAALAAEEQYASARGRAIACRAVVQRLDELFAQVDRDAIGAQLDRRGIVWAPLNSPQEVLAAAPGSHNGIETMELDGVLRKVASIPIGLHEASPTAPSHVPELGENTEELLLELGYSWDEIAERFRGG